MHLRRTTTAALTLAALLLTLALSACNPPKGQAAVTVSGAKINGSARGPQVTCTNTARVATRTWNGVIDRKQVEVEFEMDKVTGRDDVSIFWQIPGGFSGYFTGDAEDIVTIDDAKVAHYSGKVGSDKDHLTLTAALACP